MHMPPYPVFCQTPECGKHSTFKVAAEWSDGTTKELKTYALCCERCLPAWFDKAKDRHRACHLTIDETLDRPHIYERKNGLTPRPDLELETI